MLVRAPAEERIQLDLEGEEQDERGSDPSVGRRCAQASHDEHVPEEYDELEFEDSHRGGGGLLFWR